MCKLFHIYMNITIVANHECIGSYNHGSVKFNFMVHYFHCIQILPMVRPFLKRIYLMSCVVAWSLVSSNGILVISIIDRRGVTLLQMDNITAT